MQIKRCSQLNSLAVFCPVPVHYEVLNGTALAIRFLEKFLFLDLLLRPVRTLPGGHFLIFPPLSRYSFNSSSLLFFDFIFNS